MSEIITLALAWIACLGALLVLLRDSCPDPEEEEDKPC